MFVEVSLIYSGPVASVCTLHRGGVGDRGSLLTDISVGRRPRPLTDTAAAARAGPFPWLVVASPVSAGDFSVWVELELSADTQPAALWLQGRAPAV